MRNPRFGIFTGTFTVKWRAAAAVTSRVMTGTLYGAYYDLPPESQWIAWAVSAVQHGRETAPDLAGQCAERALEAGTSGNPVARNDKSSSAACGQVHWVTSARAAAPAR